VGTLKVVLNNYDIIQRGMGDLSRAGFSEEGFEIIEILLLVRPLQYAREKMGSHFRFCVNKFGAEFSFVREKAATFSNLPQLHIFRKLVFWF